MRADVQRPWRYLVRRPAVNLVIIATLALGIGASTTVFGLIHQLLWAPLPYPDAERLVLIQELTPQGDGFSVSPPTYRDLGRELTSFERIGASSDLLTTVVLSGEGDPERLQAAAVSGSLLQVLGARTASGRTFAADADTPGGSMDAVLSHRLWQRRFAGSPDVVGRAVRLDGRAFTVIGVLQAGFEWPGTADVWIPLTADPASTTLGDRDDKWLTVIGRLAAGRTRAEAEHELQAIGRRLGEQDPRANGGWSFITTTLGRALVATPVRAILWTLGGAVVCLLLLACANVTGLLLTEAVRRDGEFRLRATLGATPVRLSGQLMAESAVLAFLGAGAGVVLAFWATQLLRVHAAGQVPRIEHVHVDGLALGVALVLAIGCCVVIGIAPGIHAASPDLRSGTDGSGYSTRVGRARVRRGLIVLEVGLALVLLAGAGLMATSFARLSAVDLGFTPEHVLAVPVDLAGGQQPEAGWVPRFSTLQERLAALPGVEAVGATTTNPLRQAGFSNTVTPEERLAGAPPSGLLQAQWRSVTPGFFGALRVPILDGRVFAASLTEDGPREVMVSRALAERLWPGESPIGKRIVWGGTTGRPRTVIGVAGDIRDVRVDQAAQPMLFVPHVQVPLPGMTLLVKSRGDAAALPSMIRAQFTAIAPDRPAPDVHPVTDSRSDAMARPRLVAAAISAMAVTGVVLATSGIYALLAFSVLQRRREIAIRLAVGSAPGQVARLVLADGLRLTLTGLVLGTAAALGLGRFIGSALYGVAPADPLILAVIAVTLLAAAALASYLPARSAARVDPALALRSE